MKIHFEWSFFYHRHRKGRKDSVSCLDNSISYFENQIWKNDFLCLTKLRPASRNRVRQCGSESHTHFPLSLMAQLSLPKKSSFLNIWQVLPSHNIFWLQVAFRWFCNHSHFLFCNKIFLKIFVHIIWVWTHSDIRFWKYVKNYPKIQEIKGLTRFLENL